MNPEWVTIVRQEAFRIDGGFGQREDLQQEGLIALLQAPVDLCPGGVRLKARWGMLNYMRVCGLKKRGQIRHEKLSGDMPLQIDYTGDLLSEAFEPAPDTLLDIIRALEAMTRRQNEVLALLVDGLTLEAISQRLGITESRASQISTSIKDRINGVPDRRTVYRHRVKAERVAASQLAVLLDD